MKHASACMSIQHQGCRHMCPALPLTVHGENGSSFSPVNKGLLIHPIGLSLQGAKEWHGENQTGCTACYGKVYSRPSQIFCAHLTKLMYVSQSHRYITVANWCENNAGIRLCKFTFTIISSLPCLHTFWHAIPISLYIFNVFLSLVITVSSLSQVKVDRLMPLYFCH